MTQAIAPIYTGHAFTDEITRHGGFTFDPRVGSFIRAGESGRRGYVIGLPGTERQIIASGTDITPHDWTSALLDIYRVHGTLLESPHVFVGSWRAPDGSIIAELSTIVDVPLPDALRIARHFQQWSVWNVETGEEYETGFDKYGVHGEPGVHVTAPLFELIGQGAVSTV